MPKRGFSFEIFDLRLDEKEKNIVSVVMQSKDRLKRIFRISHKIRNEFVYKFTFKLLLALSFFYIRIKILYFSLLIFDQFF